MLCMQKVWNPCPLVILHFFLEIQIEKMKKSGFGAAVWIFLGYLCENKDFLLQKTGNPGLYFTRKSLEIQPGGAHSFSGIAQNAILSRCLNCHQRGMVCFFQNSVLTYFKSTSLKEKKKKNLLG